MRTDRHDGAVSSSQDTPAAHDAERWSARRTSFGNQADAYAYGRPTYPKEVLEWILPAGAQRVLDLGAGTGRLTERLLDFGLDVVAVEPIAEMRAHIPAPAQAIDGTAEAIPLDDASVDAVTAGQAFHWFDAPRAMAEICRVLRPGGRVGLCWNLLDDADPFVARMAAVVGLDELISSMPEPAQPPYDGIDGMSTPEQRLFRHSQRYDADRLVAYVLSRSQSILLPDDDRNALLQKVRDLAPTGEFAMPMVCEAWRGDRTP